MVAKKEGAATEPVPDTSEFGVSDNIDHLYLVPPDNYRKCDSDDVDKLKTENDRLRFIITLVNQNWQRNKAGK